jgi:hypothetical protein
MLNPLELVESIELEKEDLATKHLRQIKHGLNVLNIGERMLNKHHKRIEISDLPIDLNSSKSVSNWFAKRNARLDEIEKILDRMELLDKDT